MLKKELIDELNTKHLLLAKRIRKDNSIRRSSKEAYSFIITSLKMLYPNITYNKLRESITDDDPDGSFDAIVFNKKQKIISVFNFKNASNFGYNDIKLLAANIRLYLFTPTQSLQGLVTKAKERLKQSRQRIHHGWNVEIYVVRNGLVTPRSNVEKFITRLKNSFPRITLYHFLNVNPLIERYLQIKAKQNIYSWPIKIVSGNSGLEDPEDKIVIRGNGGRQIKALFARLTLVDIVKLQRNFLREKLDLFDANVRDFQKKKNISQKILHSIQNHPASFHIFHNGLTFSCSRIDKVDVHNYRIKSPQIINGCQTVNTLYDTYKNKINDKKLKQATILCRFYALKDEMIEKVCEATNTQIKISLWDLRSNDEIQKILEEILTLKGINYKRKKGITKGKGVFITDLAQWIYSCKFEKPAEAKNKKNKLFDIILQDPPYRKIFNERFKLEVLIMICKIASFVKNKIRGIKKEHRTFEKDADLHFVAALFKLRNKRGTLDTKYKKVHKIIKDAIKKLRRKYGEDLNYNQIFTKKEETWKIIKKKLNAIN